MSQPPVYNRAQSFTNLQVTNPTGQPQGPDLDTEYNRIKATLDAVLTNLALIQRDDGALANASVGLNQLSTAVTVGFSVPTAWATGASYVSSPASTVFNGGKFYSCLVSHTSGTFATDLAAGDWVLIADLTAIPLVAANQIAVTASGLLTTDVQGSLQALDAGKAATSHTHPSSAITDSTAAGRAMIAAVNVAAQQALLGLGAQAYVNNAIVTAIGANLALTNPISPATLVANTNDWSPTNWATSTVVYLSASSAINITGLLATTDGDVKILHNNGTNPITFTSSDAGSAAANRLLLPGPVVVPPNGDLAVQYDNTSSTKGWRKLAPTTIAPHFNCQLTKSGANLLLSRTNGALLFINGNNELVPSAGITLAPPATTTTNYYIYAFMSSGTMTLEASATAPAADATYGHQIKTGDVTRTLVGQARTISSAWVDTAIARFVRSFYNDPGYYVTNKFTTARSTTSATAVELNTEIRVEFLSWSGEKFLANALGSHGNSTIGSTVDTWIGLDGSATAGLQLEMQATGAGTEADFGFSNAIAPAAEGYHYLTLMGAANANTATWQSNTNLQALLRK